MFLLFLLFQSVPSTCYLPSRMCDFYKMYTLHGKLFGTRKCRPPLICPEMPLKSLETLSAHNHPPGPKNVLKTKNIRSVKFFEF